MNELRPIREEEVILIKYLLQKSNINPSDYTINDLVDDYEGGKMGSIGLGKPSAEYDGDIIQAEYLDTDDVSVVITLTKDTNNQILDLDFWKIDFSKLLVYPVPEKLIFKEPYLPIGE
jgi:hypothetical protein